MVPRPNIYRHVISKPARIAKDQTYKQWQNSVSFIFVIKLEVCTSKIPIKFDIALYGVGKLVLAVARAIGHAVCFDNIRMMTTLKFEALVAIQ